MNTYINLRKSNQKLIFNFGLAVCLILGLGIFLPTSLNPLVSVTSAACLTTPPPTTFGQVTQNINVATAGTYRVWSRIKAPDTIANSYYFEVDSGCAYNVGNAATIPVNTWTWVNYQDGAAASVIDVTLTAGAHVLTYTGKEANVQLDKIMLLSDLTCVPTGLGDNCAVTDVLPPTVAVSSPATGSTVNAVTTIAATASDPSGVAKVEFLIDGILKSTDLNPAYSYAWDTTTVANGSHSLIARATDTVGNTASSTAVMVTVNNVVAGDTIKPVVSLTANPTSAAVGITIALSATATDNVGVTKVEFYDGTSLLNTDTVSPYNFNWITTGASATAHSFTAKAYDAAGNSQVSTIMTVTLKAAGLPGDILGGPNGLPDGRVNALDLSALISHDGQIYPAGDFAPPVGIGAEDLAVLLAHWTW